MKISVMKSSKLINFVLPSQCHGNYWITDKDRDGKDRNFINIVANNGKWEMLSNYEVSIFVENQKKDSVILEMGKFYLLRVDREEDVLVYCNSVYNDKNVQLTIKNDAEVTIGRKETCHIQYNNLYIDEEHAKLVYSKGVWHINSLSNKGIYINGEKVVSKKLQNGDVIFIMGLKIVVIKNNIIINNIDKIKVDSSLFFQSKYPKQNIKEFVETDEEIRMYKDSDYFFKAPRFRNNPDLITLNIDPAPMKEEEDKTPLLFSMGPMLTMGMTSAVSAFTAINSVVTNNRPIKEALPSIIMAVAMLMTMVLWPTLNRIYKKKQYKKREKLRVDKYTEYIEGKRRFIKDVMKTQTTALIESFPPIEELKKTILFRKTNLWEREKDQDDFLKVRVGTGTEPVKIDIRYPEEHFSLQVDDLKSVTNKLVSDSKDLVDVPITFSFVEKYISALVGETPVIEKTSYGIILQLIAYHSYDDLKIVFFTNEEKSKFWEFAKVLPHCWNDEKTVRYFAKNVDDMRQISSVLEAEFQSRTFKQEESSFKQTNYKSYKPYYLIITDDFKSARDIEIIKNILDQKYNAGFSLFVLNDKLTNLPNECMNFICIGHNNRGVIFEDELVTNKQKKFIADYDETLDLQECAIKLANIPIDAARDDVSFPKSISFLEMYNVGKVEQLNSYNRWQTNLPINSLQAPLGVDKQGNIFKLDLHEKFHGPHGLIAGMTGSGKSELIITYILSLAVNYHPHEVSFIIIDYKGGGVALAFENKETGRKLPHIAGTITNLDTAEMNRALVSIESELRRRQKVFNHARDIANESTIDIYKYQKLYRNGVVKEPVSHLFIICDEFAELKTQQPEFMDHLISTARIGRSLGVHLILATQKPSGVVNDQIWSNSRFRICLKVQEKQDSMDMIKSPEAATLKNVGRFYLQVGYNEFFAQGLSAWSGAQYIPTDKPRKKIDNAINFIDDIGYVVKSVDDDKDTVIANNGEQLSNVIDYLIDIASEENIKVKQLWLDKIPELIYVDDLAKKYNYQKEEYIINPIVGEYDDPANQNQGLLTLNLSKDGNTIVYGSAGSGKNTFISSVVYSSMINHSASEVNFYIMDFGSEIFRTYKKAPQVGDVLLIHEVEKINNLFKMLSEKIKERKRILADYNGDFNYYNKKAEKKLPLIVVVINNYEAFSENYQMYEENMLQLTREGSQYGVVFVLTVNGTNSIRYRLRQNFKQEFVLQLNDETDYSSILGNINKMYPSKYYGRGLIKREGLYEFQTSHPHDPENLSEFISSTCEKLKSESSVFAEPVAILPDIVTSDDINSKLTGIDGVPIGINKNTLSISTWDFKNNASTIISAMEFESMNYFIKPFINQFSDIKNTTVLVMDSQDIIKDTDKKENIYYYKRDFNNLINSLHDTVVKQKAALEQNNFNKDIFANIKPVICIVVGLDSLLMKVSADVKLKFNTLVEADSLTQTIKFIFIDTIDIFKKLEYDSWYKAIVKNNQGIWIGNGISEQYTLKVSKITRELQQELEPGFGYIVKRGVPVLTKFLTTEEDGYKGDDYE